MVQFDRKFQNHDAARHSLTVCRPTYATPIRKTDLDPNAIINAKVTVLCRLIIHFEHKVEPCALSDERLQTVNHICRRHINERTNTQ